MYRLFSFITGRVYNDETQINDEMVAIEVAQRQEEAGRLELLEPELLEPWVWPMLVVGVGLAILQQLVGINTIIYYAPSIMQSTGLAASNSIPTTLPIGVVNVIFTIVALVLIDRVGRPLLLVGLVGITISLAVLGLTYLLPSLSGAVTWITLACLMLYIASFAASFGVVLWVVLPEIFPLKVRGSSMGASTILHRSSNFAVSLTFLPLIQAFGESAVFWGYALISIGAFAFVYFLMPETKERSLEEIEANLRKKSRGPETRETGRRERRRHRGLSVPNPRIPRQISEEASEEAR